MTEYLAENARLRQLSRRYAEGQLPFAEYRTARRELIEALEAGTVLAPPPLEAVPAAVTTPAVAPLADDEGVFLKTMPPQGPEAAPAAPAPAAWDGHTRILAVVMGVSFLLALGALVYVFAL